MRRIKFAAISITCLVMMATLAVSVFADLAWSSIQSTGPQLAETQNFAKPGDAEWRIADSETRFAQYIVGKQPKPEIVFSNILWSNITSGRDVEPVAEYQIIKTPDIPSADSEGRQLAAILGSCSDPDDPGGRQMASITSVGPFPIHDII